MTLSAWFFQFRTLGLWVGCWVGGFALLGCGKPAFDGQIVHGKHTTFRVGNQPETWRRLEVSNALLAFQDERDSAVISVNARCKRQREDVPLQALTNHLFLQFTERRISSEETIPFDEREARRTIMLAKLDGVERKFEVLVAKKDGCVYDFIYFAHPDDFPRHRAEFEQFVQGFHVESTHQ
jgi:hypothetical protein